MREIEYSENTDALFGPFAAGGPLIRSTGPDAPLELPTDDELLTMMGELSELLGVERCAVAYAVHSPADLPDPWHGELLDLRVLIRRLALHAGEEALIVRILDLRPNEHEDLGDHLISDLYFLDFERGQARFAVEKLGDLRGTLGPTCVEVGRAVVQAARLRATPVGYRAESDDLRAVEPPSRLEGFLACFLLGLGIPTTNACFDSRSVGSAIAASTRTAWVSSTLEFPPDLAAYLLAAIARAGERDEGTTRRWSEALNPSQRDAFDDHLAELADHGAELRERLRWGDPSDWPPARTARTEALELDDHDEDLERAEEVRDLAVRMPNRGRPVFRVRARRTLQGGVVGAVLGVTIGLGTAPGWVVLLAFACTGIGLFVGSQFRSSYCSDPKCAVKLALDASECPACGGVIAGEIDSANERLEALDQLSEAQDEAGAD